MPPPPAQHYPWVNNTWWTASRRPNGEVNLYHPACRKTVAVKGNTCSSCSSLEADAEVKKIVKRASKSEMTTENHNLYTPAQMIGAMDDRRAKRGEVVLSVCSTYPFSVAENDKPR